MFVLFLVRLFGVQHDDLRFGLQLFTDIDPTEALNYWVEKLDAKASQFYKITVTISGSIGGHITGKIFAVVDFITTKKLRDILIVRMPS